MDQVMANNPITFDDELAMYQSGVEPDSQYVPDPIEDEKTEPAPAGTWDRMVDIMKGIK